MGLRMHCGIDYGTSNSSVGVAQNGVVTLLPLEGDSVYLPSAVYRQRPDHLDEEDDARMTLRQQLGDARDLLFGRAAIQAHTEGPTDGLYVKSPKVFLGSDLSRDQLEFFTVIISRMLERLMQQARAASGMPLQQAVIGRPIRYHGVYGERGDEQALTIMREAAQAAGLQEVIFMYEPLAAALDYENGLVNDEVLLVVDVGGGTTDCSVVRVGPHARANADRSADLLSYAGTRIGGTDLDIHIGWHQIMPYFGKDGELHHKAFDAISVNSIPSQHAFYNRFEMPVHGEPEEARRRLYQVWRERLTHSLVRSAEQAKIRLTDAEHTEIDVDFVAPELQLTMNREQMQQAITQATEKIRKVIEEARAGAGMRIDKTYLTGGSAVSPVIQQAIRNVMGDAMPLVTGNMHGGVASGLALYASRWFSR